VKTIRNLITIIVLITLCTSLMVHAYSRIIMAPVKTTYIVQPGKFNMSVIVRYVSSSKRPLETLLTVYICDFFSSLCTPFEKTIILYPNTTSVITVTVNVSYPSFYIAIGNIGETFVVLSKIVCVKNIQKDVAYYGPFLIAAVNEPRNFKFSTFVNYVRHVVSWYLSHGIRIAYPCLGPPFVVITYNLNVVGKGVLGVTTPQFYILRNGTSVGCVWLVAVNESMPHPVYAFLKDVVAHELFHSAQTYYMRNSTFLQYWKENWWTIEGGAVAAPYFVWNMTPFPSLVGWSRVWFYYRWYRYDPAWAWYVLYERCMRICMRRVGAWWYCEDYCESLSYLSYYVYAPLMWYIFEKEGLNMRTMRMIYSSPSPSASEKIIDLLYDAYISYVKGFPPSPQLKVRPVYMNRTRTTAYVWYRAPLYIQLNIPYEGHYRILLSTGSVHAYIYQKGRTLLIKGNNSLITVRHGTILLLIPRVEKMPLQYEIQQHVIPVTITLLRSLEDCKVLILTPPSLVVGRDQQIIIYLANCTSLTGGVVKIFIKKPQLSNIVGVKIPENVKKNVKIYLMNKTTIIVDLKFSNIPYMELPILVLRIHSYARGIEEIHLEATLYSKKTGETARRSVWKNVTVASYLYCDFNRNGKIDIGDVVLGLKYLTKHVRPPVKCDLNNNGRFDIGDIVLLMEYIMKISTLLTS